MYLLNTGINVNNEEVTPGYLKLDTGLLGRVAKKKATSETG